MSADHLSERQLADQQRRLFTTVFERCNQGIVITDIDARILSVNSAFAEITGYSIDELTGQNPRILRSGRHDEEFYRDMWQQLTLSGQWEGEIWNRRKNGEVFPEWLLIAAVRDANDCITHYLGMSSDIGESLRAQRRIEFLANHDALTELPNRLSANQQLQAAIDSAEKSKAKVALMFLDMDHFKSINESEGHLFGDAVLKIVSTRIQSCVRESDMISRHGGDEFIVILSDLRDTDAIVRIAEMILRRTEEPITLDDHELSLTTSIGIALYPDDGKDFESLLSSADAAMYQAKEVGRNTYQFFDNSMTADHSEQLHIRNGLRRALERDEFVLHYQPQIHLESGLVIGAEALIRWKHPEFGLLPPGRFISVAEDSGLIVPIGVWVLREACRQAKAWQQAGLPEMVMAVNLSAVQFKRGNLYQSVSSALMESGLDPIFLELELTESILIRDTENVLATVRQLKLLGLNLSIDDFGTGYSSLSYLKKFKVDKLKIDQSFIRDLDSNSDDAAIVRAIIQMAKSLNLKLVAEGVENARIATQLRVFHCDEAQGYHFARPMAAEAFADFLADREKEQVPSAR
ncbi:MAG: EAL domain-containing protein [Sterolibacterium sp.]|jgi:diguanylate cyclase (GGDEF)-like protein/PAS domain S-box-containing protein